MNKDTPIPESARDMAKVLFEVLRPYLPADIDTGKFVADVSARFHQYATERLEEAQDIIRGLEQRTNLLVNVGYKLTEEKIHAELHRQRMQNAINYALPTLEANGLEHSETYGTLEAAVSKPVNPPQHEEIVGILQEWHTTDPEHTTHHWDRSQKLLDKLTLTQ